MGDPLPVLDFEKKIKTSYCIDLDTRDRQVIEGLARIKGRLKAHPDRKKTEQIAVVCYGPSLEQTWEQVRNFKHIITCSGAHKFLLDHDIVPTWHCEVDPRKHKAELIGQPHPAVEYLCASVCHQDVFDLLEGYNVKLWHVYSHESERDNVTINFPRGEWLITGGSNIGLRAMVLARFLGFKKMTVFGMDYSFKNDGTQHAGWHPNEHPQAYAVDVNGEIFYTNGAMHQYAQQFFDEVQKIGDVEVEVVGHGLLQAKIREHLKTKPLIPRGAKPIGIAAMLPNVITPEYSALNKQLHESDPYYGTSGSKRAEVVRKMIEKIKPASILDYGCISGSSRVHTPNGLVAIKKLVDSNYTGKVLSIGSDGRFEYKRVTSSRCASINGTQKHWVRIGIPKGKSHPIVTNDHPCAIIRDVLNPKIEYVEAQNMAGMNLVKLPRNGNCNVHRENPLFNSEQLSVLIGIGLGDGYFDKQGRMYNSHGLAQSEYVEFKQSILGGKSIVVPPSGKSPNNTLFFHCPTNSQTKYLRTLFYPHSKKTVSVIVDLIDPIALAFWYMDDGRLKMIYDKPYANFHTEGFTEKDQIALVHCLEENFSLKASVYSGKNGNFLHLNQKSSEQLFQIISPFVCPSMEYKLPSHCRGGGKHKFDTKCLGYSTELVSSVTPINHSSKLYDLTVSENHNFVTEHTVVHNCGKSTLAAALPMPIWEYDPAIPGKDQPPRSAELVICTDVLEHVEPECLDSVLLDLRRVTLKVCYAVINTGPAMKTLPDGRNTHLIQQPMEWWKGKLENYFRVASITQNGVEVTSILGPKEKESTTTAPPLDYSKRITPARYDGTEVKFFTPNDQTHWRARTLFTKEPVTIEWIDTFQPGEVFFDVGANVGGYSVWAAKRRGVKVVSFEPESGNYAMLCRNLVLNECDAMAYCVALTDIGRVAHIGLSSQEVGGGCHTFWQVKEGQIRQGCIGMSLTILSNEIGIKPDHIKIDVDGLEPNVVLGSLGVLDSVKSLLVEINTNLPEHMDTVDLLHRIGFEFEQSQVDKSIRKEGQFKGVGEFVFKRKKQECVVQLPASVNQKPFPWVYVENVFPPDIYSEMMAKMPTDYTDITKTRPVKGYSKRYTANPDDPFWKGLFSRMRDGQLKRRLCELFGVQNPDELEDECLLIRDVPGYSIGPHTDAPHKVITALFYLPKDDSTMHVGTRMYTPKKEGFICKGGPHHEPEDFNLFQAMPFKPNSAFFFLKTQNSFHGVAPCDVERDVLLYDIRRRQKRKKK